MRAVWQQQAALIAANTNSVQSHTGAQASHPAASAAGHAASSIFGSVFGFLSPVAKGILGLFGGGAGSAPAPLPVYLPPPPVSISGVVHGANQSSSTPPAANGAATGGSAPAVQSAAPQITVNINAMDSQSFLDRSNDIASAVRLAMLNLHPINDVVADL